MLQQTRADGPVVVAAWLLLLCAVTLLAAGAHYGDAIALGSLRQAALEAPPGDRTTVVRTRAPVGEIEALESTVATELERSLRLPGGEVATLVRSTALLPAGGGLPDGIVRLAAYEGLASHATLVDGRWAEPGRDPVEAALSDGAARALGLGVGDTIVLDGERGGQRVTVSLVGTWRALPDDVYWLGSALELEGVLARERVTEYGPLMVALDDLVAHAPVGTVDIEWRALPNLDGLRADDLDATIADLRAVPSRLRAALPRDRQFQVTTKLPDILDTVARSIVVSRSGVLLLSLQFAVLAGYAVILVAGVMVERRRAQVALLRSRGASAAHLVAMALAESTLLAATAAIVAPLLAVGVVRVLGSTGSLAESGIVVDVGIGRTTLIVTAVTGLASILALSLPTLTSIASLSGVRAALGRQAARTLPQRLGIDFALVALAGIALWQLRLYGAPLTRTARGALGVDPLLVAAPAIGLVAGAVLAIRLVPRLGEIAERLLERRRGAVAPLGGRQLARRPLSYSRSALLLMLAVSLGTFAIAQSATWDRSQSDQAAYRAATDARLVVADFPEVPAWAQGATYAAMPGVDAVEPVLRSRIDVRRAVRDGAVLAVDAQAANGMLALPPDAVAAGAPAMLDALAAARPDIGGVAIPGTPVRLAVTVDARLQADLELSRGAELDPLYEGITFSAVVEDADGRLIPLEGGSARLVGDGQRIEAAIRGITDPGFEPAWPFRIVAIELQLDPQFSVAVGTIDLVSVESSAQADGDAWTPIDLDPGAEGWGWRRSEQNATVALPAPDGIPGRIQLQSSSSTGAGGPNGPVFPIFLGTPTVFRLVAPDPLDAVPAIVNPPFLERTGLAVGDTVNATSLGRALPIRIVGSVALFPPLDPDVPFAVVDRQTFERTTFERDAVTLRPDEWWFLLAPGAEGGLLERLRGAPHSAAEVIGRDELADELSNDPIGLGVIGALGLGTAAALAFAAIGFVVSTASSATERFGEFALLRALGLSGRELSTWLSLENAFLLAIGLLAGSGLGLVLAWVVLPVSTLSDTGAPTVPPAEVVIPWPSYAPIWVLGAALLVVSVIVVTRTIRAVRITSVLRARDG